MAVEKVLIAGEWIDSDSTGVFQAENPQTKEVLDGQYPVSSWNEVEKTLDAAQNAFSALRKKSPDDIAKFLESFADKIEANSGQICQLANLETALPVEPRLAPGELPRTSGQLRKAAAAARSRDWSMPVIDTATNIRSYYAPIGPVAVFGPNNFPLAFGSVSGGDFAAAIAAGNPVIAKAHPLHPGTTRLLAEQAQLAADETGMPKGTVQMIYNMSYDDGERLAQDPRLAAIAFTGSRKGGLKLKEAADKVGKAIYLEMSSVNPVVVLPKSVDERGEEIVGELTSSCLMGTGQFCTNPGLVILEKNEGSQKFAADLAAKFSELPGGTLFSKSGLEGLSKALSHLEKSGAERIAGTGIVDGSAYSHSNTVLQVDGSKFLENAEALQTEAFGNSTLLVMVDNDDQTVEVINSLEGNLTGCIYSAKDGSDDEAYQKVEPHLRQRVGRLINDKMPTGVAVSAAMNHGGPFPATAHSGFTAVGIPGSLLRFAMLQCYDNVRAHRLPEELKDENPSGAWRLVDGEWSQAAIA